MAKKTANPGEPKPRRVGMNRRRSDRPAEELAPRPTSDVETTSDALAPSEANPSVLEPLASAETQLWPSRDDIARRAYEIYLSRGGAHGHDVEDWLEAEQELRAERTGAARRRDVH